MLLSVVFMQSCKQDVSQQPTPKVDNGTVTLGTLFEGVTTRLPIKPVLSIEPNSADASNTLERTFSQFQFVYFTPTNVDYRAIKQVSPFSPSNLNITF